MHPFVRSIAIAVLIVAGTGFGASPSGASPRDGHSPLPLEPPPGEGPVVVRAGFQLHGISDIDDEAETFEFAGVLTMVWKDARQAFDPAVEGVREKVYSGSYQFDELSPAWYPQLALVNESGTFSQDAVVLRSAPDGTQTLVATMHAVARTRLDMRRFPFDRQRLVAVFEVLGFDHTEVVLHAADEGASLSDDAFQAPQWAIGNVSLVTRARRTPYAGSAGVASTFDLRIEVQRRSFFIVRLVMFPLVVIVLLSFTVFWMDRSSLGDRISVSFIGILTGVTYQIVMSDLLPNIWYFTLINAFLSLSFLTVCATVVINLAVGAYDKRGRQDIGNRIDRSCRWIFPLTYAALLVTMFVIAFAFV
jgi:hypothetical protein